MRREPEGEFVNGSAIAAIRDAWSALCNVHPDVPPVRLALGHRSLRGHVYGRFTPAGDDGAAELLITYRAFRELGGPEVMAVLLHEAAHGLAGVRRIKDTSSKGYWHNDRFAQLAAETGLMLGPGAQADRGAAMLTPVARRYYSPAIEAISLGLIDR